MDDLLPAATLWLPGVVAMLCLMVASGFFSASETALFYLSQDELRSFRIGRSRERVAAALLSNPDRLLTAILFWNLVINLTYFATSVVVAQRLAGAGERAAAGVFSVVGLVGIIIFGEVLPKSIAVVFRRRLAPLVSWPIAAAVRLIDPILGPVATVTRVSRRAFWPHIGREPYLHADDLERAVELSELSPDVVRQERQILHNILDLSEIRVEEVMRPRGTYVALTPPVHLSDLKGELPAGNYLILQTNDEEIQGVVPLADFSSLPDEHLEQAAEEVLYVPWCANVAETLQMLRSRFLSVAAVVNEYGDVIGIVGYEDIVDTALLPEPSRARRLLQREPVLEAGTGRYEIEGITTLRYLCRRLGLEYEPAADGQVTVAGLLFNALEHLPAVGDECEWRGYRFRVTEAGQRGPSRVLVWKEEGVRPA